MTREMINVAGEGKHFYDVDEVRRAYDAKQVALHAKIQVRIREIPIEKIQAFE